MDGWTLAISIVALVVSLGSVYFTWSADRRDKDRRADELLPELTAEIKEVSGGDTGWYRIHLQLKTLKELATVHVAIVAGKGVSFTGSNEVSIRVRRTQSLPSTTARCAPVTT